MMPAAKHFDPVVGVDIHIVQPPGPVPPIPVPHPFIGMIIDPMDYVPFLGATVMVGGIPRAQAGTAGKNIPSHIPIGGVFVKPPANECEIFMGSATVDVDGDAFSHLAHPVLSCHDIGMPPPPRAKKKSKTKSMVLPTSVVLSIPSGVFVGGPPTVSLMALGMRAGMAAAGALFKKFKAARKAKKAKGKKVKPKKGKAKGNAPCGTDAHPVDVVTGACVDEIVDYDPPGACPFRWVRWYDSSERDRVGPMGRGFRHPYEVTLEATPDGFRFTDEMGETADFPAPTADGEPASGDGYVLKRLESGLYEVLEPRERFLRFRFASPQYPAALVEIERKGEKLQLGYDSGGLLAWVRDGEGRIYQIQHDTMQRVAAIYQRTPEPPHDVLGTVLQFQYDAAGCLVGVVDAFGNTHTYQYEENRLRVMRDRRGYRFEYVYDEHGRVVHTRGEDGLWEAWFEYLPEAGMTVVRYADGGDWIKFYDDSGRVTDMVNPDGGLLARRIDEEGQTVEEIDPGGNEITYLYDSFGASEGRRDQFGRFLLPPWLEPDIPDFEEPRIPDSAAGWEWGELLDPDHPRAGQIPHRLREDIPQVARRELELDRLVRSEPRLITDAMGRVVALEGEDGSRQEWRYDAEGNCIEYIDADGASHKRTYTSWNVLATETDPLGHTTRYQHSLRGLVTGYTDPGGSQTTYLRDPQERIVQVARDDIVRESYQWDTGSRLIEKRNGDGEVLMEFDIGDNGLVAAEQPPDGPPTEFQYDDSGRPVLAKSAAGEVVLAYDELGRRTMDKRDELGVERTFEADGLQEITVLDAFTTRYEYRTLWDFDIVDPTGARHRIRSHHAGLAVCALSNGTVEVAHYGEGGRCLGKHVGARDGRGWTRRFEHSAAGELRVVRDSRDGDTKYAYDAAHRLVREASAKRELTFAYDPAGNIVSAGHGDARYGTSNRLAVAAGARFEHDARGNICGRHDSDGTTRFTSDMQDMFVRIEQPARPEWSAAYDAFGRRAWKLSGDRKTTFWWDGHRLAAEQRAAGVFRVFVYADHEALVPFMFVDYDDADADPASGRRRFVFTNQVGAPVQVEDDDGRVIWRARVEPYGRTHVEKHNGIELDLRFPGHYFDAETGLHYNRFRYYDPELGRYLQPDPIGAGGGLNVYAYTANPLVEVDVLGLNCKDPGGAGKGKGERTPHNKKKALGEDVDYIAKGVGMDPKHVKNMQKRAAKRGETIIVRGSNPKSLKWQKAKYKGKKCVSKPKTVKHKTAKSGEHAGLVTKKANPGNPDPPPGHHWDEDGVLVNEQGQAVHGDYDLQHVNRGGEPIDTNNGNFQKAMNDDVCPEHKQFQHGANDNYKNPDGSPGRNPDPDEKYLVVEPDGTAKQINGTDNLQQYYKDNGMEWPYPDY